MTPPFIARRALSTLETGIRQGTLRLVTPEGAVHVFGGVQPGADGEIVIRDWRTITAALARGDIGLGDAHMAGWWESPDLEALMRVLIDNMSGTGRLAWGSMVHRVRTLILDRFLRLNSERGARANIMAHYDLGNDFYALWLDPTMSYSSALYGAGAESLEDAQRAKYRRILDRLGTGADRVLEIGCGWGGFIDEAVREDRHVTGLTISKAQHDYACQRAGARAEVRLEDYRKSQGRFPGVVSIEMFEAVGERYWPSYFRTLAERLAPDGRAMVQSITISEALFPGYRRSSDYIRHHIFPGGMLPSVTRFRAEAERQGLAVSDVFAFGKDYARTLRAWLERFDKRLPEVRALGYGEGFIRGWRLYLALCAAAFETGRIDVHQFELVPARSRH